MKQPRGRQEPRRMGNAAMVVTMLVSLCVLTYIKARYCSNPFRTSPLSAWSSTSSVDGG